MYLNETQRDELKHFFQLCDIYGREEEPDPKRAKDFKEYVKKMREQLKAEIVIFDPHHLESLAVAFKKIAARTSSEGTRQDILEMVRKMNWDLYLNKFCQANPKCPTREN